ncbi:SRPBCC family protein [Arachidicoccus sp.]|uniref:SRPBCC family protein n=1 Tax=Arachidicoccus sp. TaxID=1872624 RepID=UPI003D1C2549
MELKTKIDAKDGTQELLITREFDLPVELLFKAYTEPELIEQWMGTKVLKMENKKFGSYQFETVQNGHVVFSASGTIHRFIANQKIIRTFEMENMPLGVQLEFLEFKSLTDNTSKLSIQVIYQSVAHREQQLKMPFAQGLNYAHNRLQEIIHTLK